MKLIAGAILIHAGCTIATATTGDRETWGAFVVGGIVLIVWALREGHKKKSDS